MGPKASSKAARATASNTGSVAHSNSTSLMGSQETSVSQHWKDLMQQRKEHTIKRRTQRKEKIKNAHNERIDKLKEKISQTFVEHDQRVRALRRPGVQRLIELVGQKTELEATITKSCAELENAFNSTSEQLRIALESRIEGPS